MGINLQDKVAVVTGGGRGIGRAISEALAADGAVVAISYRADADAAFGVCGAIEASGGRARAYSANVADSQEDRAMVDAILRDWGRIDILVNNAGIGSSGKSVSNTEILELDRVMRVLAYGPFYLSQLVLPAMRQQERGDIIMIFEHGGERL